jgi:hypothetical protein
VAQTDETIDCKGKRVLYLSKTRARVTVMVLKNQTGLNETSICASENLRERTQWCPSRFKALGCPVVIGSVFTHAAFG